MGLLNTISLIISKRTAHDKTTVDNLLVPLGISIPSYTKFTRLEKTHSGDPRPLKVIFNNKENTFRLFSEFNNAKRSGISFCKGFRMASDKTPLQRKLLRSCHEELNLRTKNGETGL